MNKLILSLALWIAVSTIYAQGGIPRPPAQPMDQRAWNSILNQMRQDRSYETIENTYADIDGSPYTHDDFVEGQLIMNNGSAYEDVLLNYDSYQRGLIAQGADGDKIILDGRYYIAALLPMDDGDTVHYAKVDIREPHKLYRVIHTSDDLTLYVDEETYIQEGRTNGITDTPSRFQSRLKYYLRQDDAAPRAIKLKKKDVLKSLSPARRSIAEDILKTHRLKLKKEKDFARLLELMAQH